jgi:hypothetical protein
MAATAAIPCQTIGPCSTRNGNRAIWPTTMARIAGRFQM